MAGDEPSTDTFWPKSLEVVGEFDPETAPFAGLPSRLRHALEWLR